ncbi:MAG: hypothetical protein ABID54_00265 [Pseudomonadota bacterium]
MSVAVEARGSTEIEKGDLIFLDRMDGLRNNGTSTANNSAYPFSMIGGATKTLASNQKLAADNFLGVASGSSDSGTTENIAVATSGYFKFPLRSPKTYKVGQVAMPAGSGTSLYSQKVVLWESGSTYPLGYARRDVVRGASITFLLRSIIGPGGKIQ